MSKIQFNIKSKVLLKYMLIAITILIILNLLSIWIYYTFDNNAYPYKLFRLFYLDAEDSFPTLFSFLQFLFSTILLFIIFIKNKSNEVKPTLAWLGLSIIFLFLSFDELLSLHESLIPVFREKYNLTGFLYFAWILPYAIGLFIFGIIYLPFIFKIRRKTSINLILSGAIFVLGAVGMEMISGNYFEQNGNDLNFALLITVEESLEMLGLAYFIYALLDHISFNKKQNLQIKILN